MFLRFRRKEQPWEVVDCKAVEPVLMYYDDEEDLDLLSISDVDTRGTYVFDVKSRHTHNHSQLRSAVTFAQQQLLCEVQKKGYNILLVEGWKLTLLRKGKHSRLEVQYRGRAARAAGKPSKLRRPPPFMGVLHAPH